MKALTFDTIRRLLGPGPVVQPVGRTLTYPEYLVLSTECWLIEARLNGWDGPRWTWRKLAAWYRAQRQNTYANHG